MEPRSLRLSGGRTAACTTEEYDFPLNCFLCISCGAALRTIQVSRTYFLGRKRRNLYLTLNLLHGVIALLPETSSCHGD